MRLAIRHKLFLAIMSVIVVFVVAVNYLVFDLLADITRQHVSKTIESSVEAYRRFESARRDLFRIRVEAMSEVPHLKATLSIPDVDKDTVSYAGASLRTIADLPMTLIFNQQGVLLADVNNSGLTLDRVVELPGVAEVLEGESYYGIWMLDENAYRVSISPVISGEDLIGMVVVGEPLGTAADISVLKDLAGVDVALILKGALYPPQGELEDSATIALLTAALSRPNNASDGLAGVKVAEFSTSSGVYYAATVPYSTPKAGAIVFYVSRAEVAATLDSVRWLVIVVSIIGVLFSAWISMRVAFKISSPLRELTTAAQAFGQGILDVPLSISSTDEVGALARAFNTMAHDIAANREELVASKEAAEASSRAKGTFLATMSHEIRTPLNGIIGMANLLQRSDLMTKQVHYCSTISNSSKALLAILNDILDLSKIDAGRLQIENITFDLHDVVEETVQLVAQSAADKQLNLICDIRLSERVFVHADAFRLRQVLTNLLSNAIKFTDAGRVVVVIEEMDRVDNIATVRFEVTDTGIGMSEASLARVFEPFVQAENSMSRRFGGSGLGLSISRQLVELMDGKLYAESALDEGSRFWLDVPLEITNSEIEEVGHRIKGRNVRVLDSDLERYKMLTTLLSRWGLITVEDDTYGLLLVDGDVDSIVTTAVPVIRMVDITQLHEEGIDDAEPLAVKIIPKPIRRSTLFDAITELLDPSPGHSLRVTTAKQDSHGGFDGMVALLAEDNQVNQEVACESLEHLGLSVILANNGQEAIELYQQFAPDVIFMDCQMPLIDGYEATKEIRRLERGEQVRTPIIALTANAFTEDRERCLACGMDDFISKPFELSDLAVAMAHRFASDTQTRPGQPHEHHVQMATPVENLVDLDPTPLDALRSLGEKRGTDVLQRVLDIYLRQTPELIAHIGRFLLNRDFQELTEAAHKLKSSSANIGASAIANMCAQLEHAGHAENLESCPIGLSALEHAYARIKPSLASIGDRSACKKAETHGLDAHDMQQVLVVDDDPAFRVTVGEAMRVAGFGVTEAGDGPTALEEALDDRPDLVLMDAMMPDVDGFETCRRFRNTPKLAEVPILMVTGLDDRDSIDLAFECGASGFVSKPIQYQVLAHRVRFVIRASETAAALRDSRRRLFTAQRMARLGYWVWHAETQKFTMSDELSTICGLQTNERIESLDQFTELIHEDDRHAFCADFKRVSEGQVGLDSNYRLHSRNGSLLHASQHWGVESQPGEPVVVVAAVQDITVKRTAEERVRALAYYDSLTGLANRTYLYQRLDEMIKSARRRKVGFALFFMDLDRFKDVNDSLGHDQGDALLKIIAQRLKTTLRDNDCLARLGGDEFCMLLEDLSDEIQMAEVAMRCLKAVEAVAELSSRSIHPQVSIGISRFPEDGDDAHSLLRAADAAMYAAKESGKHRFEFFDEVMTLEAESRLLLAQDLRNALRRGEFELYYQPQISLKSGAVIAHEALLRWNHPTKGLVSPGEFIPELERLSLINDVGDWVIQEACKQIAQWNVAGVEVQRVCVNIAPTHFQSTKLVGVVKNALQEFGVSAERLELEVTETSLQYSEQTLTVFEQLKKVGVSLAIDDFGAGYSSLGSLQHLPIDCLKIDRIFIRDLLNNPKDAVLLGTIMTLAHALDFSVVAEGVEELEQVRILRGLDCDLVQGFFFSRPVPANEIPELTARLFLPDQFNARSSAA